MKSGYVSCNFMDLNTGKPVFDAYKMETYGDTRVAYVGITTPESFSKAAPVYFQDKNGNYIYGFREGNEGRDLYTAVQTAVNAARKDGADYVVAVGHCGVEPSSAPWRSTDIIANVSGLTAFLDGHSHSTIASQPVTDKDGKTVPLSSTGTELNAIGKLVIKPDGAVTTELVTDYAAKDPDMTAFIKTLQAENQKKLDTVLGVSDVTLTTLDKDGKRAIRNQETNLGDFLADAFRVVGQADIGWMNGGGIRADLEKGDVTYGDVLNVFPYGNTLCVAEAKGGEILDILEMAARNYPHESGAFLHVSGLSYTIDLAVPSPVTVNEKGEFTGVSGPRRVKDVQVGGAALDPDKTYTVASINYLIKEGGDGLTVLKDNKLVKDAVMDDVQVVTDYITKTLQGRITDRYAASQGRITVGAAGLPFTDVPADAWYHDGVVYAYENNLFSGTGADTFSPAAAMTRGQLVTVLWRMAGQPEAKTGAAFSDVTPASAFAKAIAWAAETKVAGGYADGTFQPNKPVNREQFATILYNYAKSMQYDTTAGGMAIREYADYDSISVFALPALTWANAQGLIQGSAKTHTVNPKGTAPRAQAAVILQRFCTTVAK